MRIGHGYDVHRLVEGRKLILGGVEVPYEKGLLGHSDADVLAHAVMDAVLGAAALGDIGQHFPDTAEEYAGADSLVLARRVAEIIDRSTAGASRTSTPPSSASARSWPPTSRPCGQSWPTPSGCRWTP